GQAASTCSIVTGNRLRCIRFSSRDQSNTTPMAQFMIASCSSATANGSSTPGDRISIFFGGGGLLDMTADGRKLYNQIFAYALGIEAPNVGVHDFMLY
ncbi:MAG: hypothetical protein ACP5I1_03330, partial [Candidatus Hinthialibacter sp.]